MQDKIENVCIITCSDTYEKIRADFMYRYFVSKGINTVVHTTDYLHIEKKKRSDVKDGYIMHETLAYKKNLSLDRINSHRRLADEIVEGILQEDYDLLWVILPPNSLAKAVAKYKSQHSKTKIVFDILDMWPESMPLTKIMWTPPVRYWRKLRDKYLSEADCIVTECALYKHMIKEIVPEDKIRVLYLGRDDIAEPSKLGNSSDTLSLCYLGSINNIIDIDGIIEVARKLSKYKKVVIHIIGDGEKRRDLLDALEKDSINYEYYGKIFDPSEKEAIFSQCQFGLNIMVSSVAVGLTMKSMDYFQCGLPVINNIHGDTWDFIEREKIGVNVDNNFEENILELIEDVSLRERTRNFFIKNLSREAIETRMDSIIEDLLQK